MAVGAITLTAIGTAVVIALDRLWHNHRAGWSTVEAERLPIVGAE